MRTNFPFHPLRQAAPWEPIAKARSGNVRLDLVKVN